MGVFSKVATCCDPEVTRTASGFHRLKAFTGPPDQERQERQWQYPMASGAPVTSTSTAPQKQLPVCFMYVLPQLAEIDRIGFCQGISIATRRL